MVVVMVELGQHTAAAVELVDILEMVIAKLVVLVDLVLLLD
jgi:hypothetical protein